MSDDNFGVWCVEGKAWVRSVLGGILRYRLDEAERVAGEQREAYPESTWAVHYIGEDEQPYLGQLPIIVRM